MENTCFRKLLRSKIHRATVTHADLHYEGSISMPPELLAAAGMLPFEAVNVWNVTAGSRFETYTISGQLGLICVNGAAARLVQPGDIIIIASFGFFPDKVAAQHEPTVVFVDDRNKVVETRAEVAGPSLAISI